MSEPRPLVRWLTHIIWLAVVAIAVGYCLVVIVRDWSSVVAGVERLGLSGFLVVLSLSLVNYIVRSARWIWLLRVLGERLPLVDGSICYFSGFALTITPAKVGEAVKALYLHTRHGVSYSHTLAGIIAERIADLVAILLISAMALTVFEQFRVFSAVFVVLLLLGVGLVISGLLERLLLWLKARVAGWINRAVTFVAQILNRSQSLLGSGVLSGAVLIGVVSWSAEAFAFSYIAQAAGVDINVMVLMGVFTLGMLIGAASFIPGGVGSAELSMILMLELLGVTAADAVFITLVSRLTTLWFAVLLGALAMLYLGLPKGSLQSLESALDNGRSDNKKFLE